MKTQAITHAAFGAVVLPTLAQALAIRTTFEKRDGSDTDDSIWKNSNLAPGANLVRFAMSDQKVNWGSTPPWNALDSLHAHCHRKYFQPRIA
jgi:hypothetical protein